MAQKTALVRESRCSRNCNKQKSSGRGPDGLVPNFYSNDDWQLNFDRDNGNSNDNDGFFVFGETVILRPFGAEFLLHGFSPAANLAGDFVGIR